MAKSTHFKARGEPFLQMINETLSIPEYSGLSNYSKICARIKGAL